MSQKKKNLTRLERLANNTDIANMFKFAKRIGSPGISLLYRPNDLQYNRFAVLLRRGFKTAVQRNYQKRVVRECYRNLKNLLITGMDIVILLFPDSLSYSKRYKQILSLFLDAKLLLNYVES